MSAVDKTQDYRDCVVLVTGGGRGIGRGISEQFLAAGAHVLVCGRNKPDTMPACGDSTAQFFQADVREHEQCQAFVDDAVKRWGRVDVLVNNAGGSPLALTADSSPRFADKILQLNLAAPFYCAQCANAVMQGQSQGGNIINIASVSAVRPAPGTAIYGAAKAGLVNLGTSLAVEWAPKVRVNSIVAGLIQTEQTHLYYEDEADMADTAATIPMLRMGVATDIADACLFLASSRAKWISGAALQVHGGGEPLPPPGYVKLRKQTPKN